VGNLLADAQKALTDGLLARLREAKWRKTVAVYRRRASLRQECPTASCTGNPAELSRATDCIRCLPGEVDANLQPSR
jgi:hypothetical protein